MATAALVRSRAAKRERLAKLGIELRETVRSGNKYHNVKAVYNGDTYDSSGEAEYAMRLDLKLKAGEITDWERPVAMALTSCPKCHTEVREPCRDAKGRPLKAFHRDRITYKPDFWICGAVESIQTFKALRPMVTGWYVDYKGSHITETEAFRLKVKLWRLSIPFELRVVYSDGSEKVVASGADVFDRR